MNFDNPVYKKTTESTSSLDKISIHFSGHSHGRGHRQSLLVSYFLTSTVEPLFNEVPRDWDNWFIISRDRYTENLVITNLLENNQSVHYIGV